MCARTYRASTFSERLQRIQKETGLSKEAIINARRELVDFNLIKADRLGGPSGGYQFTVSNADDYPFPLNWDKKPWPRYFPVPSASMLSAIFPHKWTGTDALVYDELSKRMSRTGRNELELRGHWFKAVHKTTLHNSEERLKQTGFIRLKNRDEQRVIEILNPETSLSMPQKGADQEPRDRAYYIDEDTGSRKLLTEEGFTPKVIETYFRKSLPRAAEWVPGSNAHCPFHDDQTPSLSINIETGQFHCHACGIQGNKLVTFEMRLLDTDDVQEAWKTVAKKICVRLSPRSRGKVTHEHHYRDRNGEEYYRVRRYEDGSASYSRYLGYGFVGPLYKPGLAGRKRILYNLPEVIAADVVILVEGEKKADILTALELSDSNGRPVAVTTTGGAESWRIENVEYLTDKRVVLLPDTDPPGQRYREAVNASLERAAIEFRIVDFDGLGSDFREYLQTYGDVELLRFINCNWLMSPEEVERQEQEPNITI